MKLVEAHDVWVKYRGARDYSLKGIDITVSENEVIAVIGPTGAGKTTLCKVLAGIIPNMGAYDEFRGTVIVDGQPTQGRRIGEISRSCAMVFQDYESQLFRTTVELEVAFGPENLSLPRDEIRRRVAKAIADTGLLGLEKRYSFALSGGQKQRLAIASLLSLQPSLLILDEATSDLDPAGKREIYDVAKNLLRAGVIKSLLIVDHHLDKLPLLADRVIVMDGGRIMVEGKTGDVLSDVETLRGLGLQPPDTAVIFSKLFPEKRTYPITVEEALKRFPKKVTYHKPVDKVRIWARDALSVAGIWFAYETGHWIIRDVSLTIPEGQMLALIGQNGSGKTTLAQLMVGILKPSRGSIHVFGRDVTKEGVMVRGRDIGYIFQNPDYQIFSQTVQEEISYGLRAAGLSSQDVEARVKRVAEMVGITDILDQDPFFLAKADRQRVAVASILALNPRVIILDEPTTGLSPGETMALMDTVKSLNRAGTTVITITHDMWVVARYCERVVVMSEGRIILDEDTRTAFSKEEFLEKFDIEPPQAARLSNALFGATLLTPEEFVENVRVG
ncbi:MAG: energy-coupling factor transporter ATPase [Nitrososphaerota archaeon]